MDNGFVNGIKSCYSVCNDFTGLVRAAYEGEIEPGYDFTLVKSKGFGEVPAGGAHNPGQLNGEMAAIVRWTCIKIE